MQMYFNVIVNGKKYDCMLCELCYPFSSVYKDAVFFHMQKIS
jgi:hypothetical protein